MLDTHKKLAAAKTDADKAMYQQRIDILDSQARRLVSDFTNFLYEHGCKAVAQANQSTNLRQSKFCLLYGSWKMRLKLWNRSEALSEEGKR